MYQELGIKSKKYLSVFILYRWLTTQLATPYCLKIFSPFFPMTPHPSDSLHYSPQFDITLFIPKRLMFFSASSLIHFYIIL